MKNNEEFRASVFEKAAAYKEKQRKKRSRRVRFVLVLTVCALIAVPLIYTPIGLTLGHFSTADFGGTAASSSSPFPDDNTPSGSAGMSESVGANATVGSSKPTVIPPSSSAATYPSANTTSSAESSVATTASAAVTTTATTVTLATTVTHVSSETTVTSVTATTATRITAVTATYPSATTATIVTATYPSATTATQVTPTYPSATSAPGVVIPDISAGDRIFANGAFAYKTEYEGKEKEGESTFEYYYYPESFPHGELGAYAKDYISPSFLNDNALIVVKATVSGGVPVLDRVYGMNDGKNIIATVFLAMEEGMEHAPETWIMLIPVSKSTAAPMPDSVSVSFYEYPIDR
ncbi:MAG: hypothetical protein IJX27_07100 [Clostridia bacterium]|nr:hypothetical protein [Clostridia bacterium]